MLLRRSYQRAPDPLPAAVIIDSQTVVNTPGAVQQTGIDAGKRTKGRKRLFLTDAAGNLLHVLVFAASLYDGTQALRWWMQQLGNSLLLQDVVRIYGDTHFGSRFKEVVKQRFGIDATYRRIYSFPFLQLLIVPAMPTTLLSRTAEAHHSKTEKLS